MSGNSLPDFAGEGREIFQAELAFQADEKAFVLLLKRNLITVLTVNVSRSRHGNVFPAPNSILEMTCLQAYLSRLTGACQ